MLIKKLGTELLEELRHVATFLRHMEGMNIIVEPEVHRELEEAGSANEDLPWTFSEDQAARLGHFVDFVVCLGGDGVLLHTAQLFGEHVPPIIAFHLGSLGFLSQHRCAITLNMLCV